MALGTPPTKQDIDNLSSSIARDLDRSFLRIQQMQEWLASQTTETLVALGYTEEDVSVLKSAYADLDLLRGVYQGEIDASKALGAAKDFRTFAKRFWGINLL